MALDLKLPLLGDVMTEGTLVNWLRQDGQRVNKGEPLYLLETDKVSLEVEAPTAGVLQCLVDAGSVVPVGGLVGRLLDESAVAASSATGQPDSSAAASTAVAERLAATGTTAVQLSTLPERPDEVRATPAARRLARELGLDLQALKDRGRVREADVQAYFDAHSVRVDSSGVELGQRRRIIAERMVRSLREMAQLTISLEVDMTECLGLREQLKQLEQFAGARPTITDLVLRATVLALRQHPQLNATLIDGRLCVFGEINLGLAVDADEGLMAPVIRHAGDLSLAELAEQTKSLADRARSNQVSPDDLQGGTFTVTSLGALGIDFFTPIVNPPQVAIMGIGRISRKLALMAGRLEERQAMYLNLSFDHRAIDGAPAARFLNAVKQNLELPAALIV